MSWFCVLGRVHWKPAPKPPRGPSSSPNLSGLIRRSMSCPRSISSLTAQSPTNDTRRPKTATHMANGPTAGSQTAPAVTPMTPARPHTASRSQSLSRNTSANRVPHSSSLGAIHSNTASVCLTWYTSVQFAYCVHYIIVYMLMGLLFPNLKNLRTVNDDSDVKPLCILLNTILQNNIKIVLSFVLVFHIECNTCTSTQKDLFYL